MNKIWVRSSLCLVASLAQLLLKNALKLTFKKGPRIRAYFRMQWQQYSVHGVGGSKFLSRSAHTNNQFYKTRKSMSPI